MESRTAVPVAQAGCVDGLHAAGVACHHHQLLLQGASGEQAQDGDPLGGAAHLSAPRDGLQ